MYTLGKFALCLFSFVTVNLNIGEVQWVFIHYINVYYVSYNYYRNIYSLSLVDM